MSSIRYTNWRDIVGYLIWVTVNTGKLDEPDAQYYLNRMSANDIRHCIEHLRNEYGKDRLAICSQIIQILEKELAS